MKELNRFVDRAPQLMVMGVGMAIAISLGIAIPSTHGNILTGVAKFAGVATFICALIWPRTMLYSLVVMAGCLDFFKRLLTVFGQFSENDLAVILTIAPLTLGGVLCGHIIHRIFQHGKILTKREWFIFICAASVISISFLKAVLISHNVLRAGQSVIDGMTYLLSVLVVVGLIKDERAAMRFINFILGIFFFVALYGIFQFCFGLRGFEVNYMLSGFTSSIMEFQDVRPRVFSTLNSSHAYGACMAMLSVLAFARTFLYWRRHQSFRMVDLLLNVTFGVGLALSFGRTAWMQGAMGIAGIFFFTTPLRTKVFYGLSVGAFLLILLNSEYIMDKLPDWERDLPMNSISGQQAFHLSTYSDRLMGFTNFVRDKSYWTYFGVKDFSSREQQHGDRYLSHDAFTAALLTYGIVGVFVMAVISVFFLVQIHRGILSVKDRDLRFVSASTASTCFAVFFSGFLSGSSVTVYPINFLFWSLIGCTLVIVGSERRRVSPTALIAEPPFRRLPPVSARGGRRPLIA